MSGYVVHWTPRAAGDLAALWNASADRDTLKAEVDELDALLVRDPTDAGESREGATRIAFSGRLAALFDVDPAARRVTVWKLWRRPKPFTST